MAAQLVASTLAEVEAAELLGGTFQLLQRASVLPEPHWYRLSLLEGAASFLAACGDATAMFRRSYYY